MSVSIKYKNFLQGIAVLPKSISESSLLGEIEVLNTTNKLYFYNSATYGSDAIVQENVPATLSNKTLNLPLANTITGVTGGDLSLQAVSPNKVVVENITFDANTISSAGDININSAAGQNTYFKVTGTDVVRVDLDGIAFLNQKDARFYDSDNSNYVAIDSSATVPSNYTITLPATSPTANTALVYDGTAYKWGAAGGADSAGANDDILATAFRARILDSFDDAPSAPPTGASTINSLTTTATHVPANQLYAIQYDGTQTLSGVGTTYSLGASPSFTLAAGDVLVAGGEIRKITVLGTPNAWVNFTIESAFVGSPSGPCVVSQAVSSKELYGSVFDGDSISDAFSNTSFSEYLIDYQDSATAIYQTGTSPLVGYSVSQDGSTWSNPVNRPQYQTDEIQSGAFASPGTALYVRLFANANTLASSGTINLLEYRAYMQKSPIVASGLLNQAYARLDGSLLQDCTLDSTSGKTQVALDWPYSNDVNTPAAFGTIDVYINGQFIPRQNSAGTLLTSGAFYKEISSTVIELDTDYSATAYAVQIIQRQPIGNFTSSTGSSSSAVGSGLKNYLTTYKNNPGNGDFETGDTSGWSKFTTTLTGVIPTGSITLTAGSINTFQATATTPLAAVYSLLIGASGSLGVGQGFISEPFTIDLEDRAKVLTFSFAYQTVSGTMNFSGTSSNTWAVYIYDDTVDAWIQPAGVYNLVQTSGAGLATGTFQTTSTSTSYRIAVICINTATNISMEFDSFFVGPQISVNAPAVGDWQAYTPTFTNLGVVTGTDFKWRRVGNILEIIGYGKSATVASNQRFTLPAGLNIDTSVSGVSATNTLGFFNRLPAAAGSTVTTGGLFYDSALGTQVLRLQTRSDTGLYETTATSAISNNEGFSCRAFVPIQGWSSNTVASADTDTRVVVARAQRTTTQNLNNNAETKVQFDLVNEDTHGSFDSTTNYRYTIPVSGRYIISGSICVTFTGNNGSARAILYVDGSSVDRRGNSYVTSVSTQQNFVNFSFERNLNAGQYIELYALQGNSGAGALNLQGNSFETGATTISINRLSGPAIVQASETVACRYSNISGALTTSTDSLVTFTTKDFDTHNAYASGLFTAPVSGIYQVNAQIVSTSATAVRTNAVSIFKGASIVYYKFYGLNTASGGTNLDNSISGLVKCVAGDTISVKVWDNGASPTVLADNTRNNLSIVRVGN
jgi:hypothetical protein